MKAVLKQLKFQLHNVLTSNWPNNNLIRNPLFENVRPFSKFGPTDLKHKNSTAQSWLKRQLKDPYVRKARQEDYRCRSAFKLIEIDDKYQILHPGQVVIDCGAAPGSWSQVVAQRINKTEESNQNLIISIDLQVINPIDGVITLNKQDFTTIETQNIIKNYLKNRKVDVILSDMSPSSSGIKSLDHDISVQQFLSVFKFSLEHLKDDGTLLIKVFQGGQINSLIKLLEKSFKKVNIVKPHASRMDSSELYLLSRNFFIE